MTEKVTYMTCYGCKGKGQIAGEVCSICGGLGKIPVPPDLVPPQPKKPEKKQGDA